MDATSRKLIRRARLRRTHDRHARAITKGYRKKPEALQWAELGNHHERHSRGTPDHSCQMRSYDTVESTIPTLPRVSNTQYLTANHLATKHPKRTRTKGAKSHVSDSYEPSSTDDSEEKLSRGGNFSDTAVYLRQPPSAFQKRSAHRIETTDQQALILTRMIKEKTENMELSNEVLQDIKEMSSHLKIVNWLLDSGSISLRGKAKSNDASTNSTYTTSSGNLVVVRRSSNNWFDVPRFTTRDEFSPVSLNSELKSDFEEELSNLTC